jgi:dihydroflavonol-4-reductase
MLSRSDITLVTGATGFVGAAVARNLAQNGFPLRLLVRKGGDRRNVLGLEAELVEGDLAVPESLPAAVAGCRYLFHVAADYRLWVPDAAAMRRVNIDGGVIAGRGGGWGRAFGLYQLGCGAGLEPGWQPGG